MNLFFKISKFKDRKEKIICGLFLASLLALAVIAGVGRSVSFYSDIKFSGFKFWILEIILLIFLGLIFWGYKNPPARFWVYAGLVLGVVIFAFLPPLSSGDALTSLFRIKIISLTHTNPYLVAPSQFPGDPWFAGTSWRHIPMPYGPLWVLLSLVFIPMVKIGLGTALFFYKAVMGAAAICSGAIVRRIAEKLGANGSRAEFIFLWNPLVLLAVISDAHNDILMILPLLLAVYFLLEEKYELAIGFLVASALIKYATIVALPFFLLHLYRKKIGKARIFRSLAVAAVLAVFVFYIFWQGTYTFRGLILASSIVSSNSFIVHTASFFGAGLGFFVKYKELVLAAAAAAAALIFFWSVKAEGRILKGIFWSLIIVLLSSTDMFNWYLLWPLALAPFMESGKRPYYTAALALFGLLHINRPFWETLAYAAAFYLCLLVYDYGPKRAVELCRKRIFGKV